MLRFTCLVTVLFALILLIAGTEGFVLWLAGFRYVPKSSVQGVAVGHLSMDDQGEWATSRVGVDLNWHKTYRQYDVLLHDLRGQIGVRMHVERLQPQSVAISPTANTVAIGNLDGSVYTQCVSAGDLPNYRAGLGHLQRLDRGGDHAIHELVFSPDGRLLAAVGNRFIRVWRLQDGKLLQKRRHNGGVSPCLSFLPDSRTILSHGTATAAELCLWDGLTGKIIKTLRSDGGSVVEAVTSPDGQLVATIEVGESNIVRVQNLETGNEIWRLSSPTIRSLAFAPDGQLLAAVAARCDQHQIDVFDIHRGEIVCQLSADHPAHVVGARFASDGLLYSWDGRGVIRAWHVGRRREHGWFSLASILE